MHGLWGEPHCGGCIVVINSVKPFLLDKDYSADARVSDTAQNQQRTYFQLEHPTEARKLRRSVQGGSAVRRSDQVEDRIANDLFNLSSK